VSLSVKLFIVVASLRSLHSLLSRCFFVFRNHFIKAYHATIDPQYDIIPSHQYNESAWTVPIEVRFSKKDGRGVYTKANITKGTIVWDADFHTAVFNTSHAYREFLEYLIADNTTKRAACDCQIWIDVAPKPENSADDAIKRRKRKEYQICQTFDEAVLFNTREKVKQNLKSVEKETENPCGAYYYIATKALEVGYQPDVILAGRRTNEAVAGFISQHIVQFLFANGYGTQAKIGVFGATFKEDVPDPRNSKVQDLLLSLKAAGLKPLVHDPMLDCSDFEKHGEFRLSALEDMEACDVIVYAVPHAFYSSAHFGAVQDRLNKGGLLVDIKSKLDRSAIRQDIHYWSL